MDKTLIKCVALPSNTVLCWVCENIICMNIEGILIRFKWFKYYFIILMRTGICNQETKNYMLASKGFDFKTQITRW